MPMYKNMLTSPGMELRHPKINSSTNASSTGERSEREKTPLAKTLEKKNKITKNKPKTTKIT